MLGRCLGEIHDGGSGWAVTSLKSSQGRLSARRRKQYYYLPADVLDRIEEVVCESFGFTSGDSSASE